MPGKEFIRKIAHEELTFYSPFHLLKTNNLRAGNIFLVFSQLIFMNEEVGITSVSAIYSGGSIRNVLLDVQSSLGIRIYIKQTN